MSDQPPDSVDHANDRPSDRPLATDQEPASLEVAADASEPWRPSADSLALVWQHWAPA
jgi:hypothetical protein